MLHLLNGKLCEHVEEFNIFKKYYKNIYYIEVAECSHNPI